MKYRYQKPHESISAYVRTVLVVEGFSEPDAAQLPLFTNGMPALLSRTEKDLSGNENILQLTLFGKSIPPDSWIVNGQTTIIVYFFKPFAMAALFNIPATKLAAAPVDLSHWNAHQANAVQAQLVYAGSTARKVEILDHLLIHQLRLNGRECELIRYATDQIMYDPETTILSSLPDKLNISERTFQRMFKKYVGITAGQYRRICQFQLSFTQLRAKKFSTLADVAYDNGFADQSHFIRSFREFTQTTPHTYLRSGLAKKNQ